MRRAVACSCGGRLAPWGFARPRSVRGVVGRVRPRRGRCVSCRVTRVLLPAFLLVRRGYGVAVVGEVLRRAAHGAGFRTIARVCGVPAGTVRSWLRRARANGAAVIAVVMRWLGHLEPQSPVPQVVGGSVISQLVEVAGLAGAAGRRRTGAGAGVRMVAPWALVTAVASGWWMGPVFMSV